MTLKQLRLKAGLTQAQVARLIPCNSNHYSQIERGIWYSPKLRPRANEVLENILKEGKVNV